MFDYNSQLLQNYIDSVVDYDKVIYYDGSKDDGRAGKVIEETCFGVKSNSRPEADLSDIGFEIKAHNFDTGNSVVIGSYKPKNVESLYNTYHNMINKDNNFTRKYGFNNKNRFIVKDGKAYYGESSCYFNINDFYIYIEKKVCNGIIYVRYIDIDPKKKMIIKDVKVLKNFNMSTFKKMLSNGDIQFSINIKGNDFKEFVRHDKTSVTISEKNLFKLFDICEDFIENKHYCSLVNLEAKEMDNAEIVKNDYEEKLMEHSMYCSNLENCELITNDTFVKSLSSKNPRKMIDFYLAAKKNLSNNTLNVVKDYISLPFGHFNKEVFVKDVNAHFNVDVAKVMKDGKNYCVFIDDFKVTRTKNKNGETDSISFLKKTGSTSYISKNKDEIMSKLTNLFIQNHINLEVSFTEYTIKFTDKSGVLDNFVNIKKDIYNILKINA